MVSEGYFPWERQADITHQHGDHQRTGVCEVLISAALKQFMSVPYIQDTEAVTSGTFSDALVTPCSMAPQISAVLFSLCGTKPSLRSVSTPVSTALFCSSLPAEGKGCLVLQGRTSPASVTGNGLSLLTLENLHHSSPLQVS